MTKRHNLGLGHFLCHFLFYQVSYKWRWIHKRRKPPFAFVRAKITATHCLFPLQSGFLPWILPPPPPYAPKVDYVFCSIPSSRVRPSWERSGPQPTPYLMLNCQKEKNYLRPNTPWNKRLTFHPAPGLSIPSKMTDSLESVCLFTSVYKNKTRNY